MSYTITSAQWGNIDNTAAVLTTVEAGAVAVSSERVELWQQFQDWIALGNVPTPHISLNINQVQRDEAKQLIDFLSTREGKALRAIVALLVDGSGAELNVLRRQVVGIATPTFDPPSLANNASFLSPAVNVANAAFGDVVHVSTPYSLEGFLVAGCVSAAGQVKVRIHNVSGGAINLPSGQWRIVVHRPEMMPERTLIQATSAILAKIDSGVVDGL